MNRKFNFKARAHLLKLLGDQLIGNDRLAIFELVKNSYDANATIVDINLDLFENPPSIRVQDNGIGMSIETIEGKWMELGTDSKRGENRSRSPEPFNRLPLGEKGIGRLAVHKLGSQLCLSTKSKGHSEYKIDINWPEEIENSEYIDDVEIDIFENATPQNIKGESGTLIEISGLHKLDWKRGEIRSLNKLITSIISPFSNISDFKVNLNVQGSKDHLKGLPDVREILDESIWKFEFEIDLEANFKWNYSFNPPIGFKSLNKNNLSSEKDNSLELGNSDFKELILEKTMLNGIGPIKGDCYFYMLSKDALSAGGNYLARKNYLKEQTGVRVYRDDIRVFNYGESKDDWLDLNTARINNPSKRLGTNSVIAAISLDLEKSQKATNGDILEEKTNREGFDENNAFERLQLIVSSAFDKFFRLHIADRETIEDYIKGVRETKKPDPSTNFENAITDISSTIKKHGLEPKIGNKVEFIATEYKRMQDFTLNAGLKGLNLAVIFHEVEREVDYLSKDIKNEENFELLKTRVQHLVNLIEGFRPLLRRNQQKTFPISTLIMKTKKPMESRFKFHGISVSAPVLIEEDNDFTITAPYGLLMAALQNLLNNSMYWSRLRYEKDKAGPKPGIGIFTLLDWFEEGPAIVIADNGPGFTIPPEKAVDAFVTDRVEGAGLGLYFVNLAMESVGGKLLIMQSDDLDLPEAFSGAAVVMLFKAKKDV